MGSQSWDCEETPMLYELFNKFDKFYGLFVILLEFNIRLLPGGSNFLEFCYTFDKSRWRKLKAAFLLISDGGACAFIFYNLGGLLYFSTDS